MLLLELKYKPLDFGNCFILNDLNVFFCGFVISKKRRLHGVKVVAVVVAGCKIIFCVVCSVGPKGHDIMAMAFMWSLVSAMVLILMVGSSSHCCSGLIALCSLPSCEGD